MRLFGTDAVFALVGAVGVAFFATPLVAQTGTVDGTVRHAQSGEPVAAAQVVVQGLGIGTLTQNDGRFSLRNVPVGEQTVEIRVIGFATATRVVSVDSGERTTISVNLAPEVVPLSEVVATGTIGATARVKLPFTVDQIRSDEMPVIAINAASAIQGKVAGATVVSGSGRPGEAPSILLRGATSIDASGRSQEPLYIVDGVILGSSVVDIDAMDIDQVEIVKGAAAASLYGSRAANGVVVIKTRRGSQHADGQVRYTLRSSYGTSALPGTIDILQSHFYAMNADQTMFINADGSECHYVHCAAALTRNGSSQWNQFAVNPWPGGTFDQVGRFFSGGNPRDHYLSASGRQGGTNFLVSFSRTDEDGIMRGQDGFRRNNFRLNVDQVVRPDVNVSASAFYSRSKQQDFTEGSGNPVFGLTRMQAGVDLAACQDTPLDRTRSCLKDPQNLILNANPQNLESANPLYELLVRRNDLERGRFLASTNVRYSPSNWLDIDADLSYDRLDQERFASLPKGYRTLSPNAALNDGDLLLSDWRQEALNSSITASFRRDLSEGIVNRTQVRYLYEQQDNELNSTGGNTFGVADVPTFGNIDTESLEASSSRTTVRADGYFLITNFDIHDRYILDALIRNDGSSLFGADERRHWYGRVAGAWRVAQEDWFNVDMIDELKLRYSYGTAGGRPRFEAQYETFSVSAGQITPINLGNRFLKPEHSAEQEAGIDVVLNGSITAGLTYANTVTTNQILQVPLPSYTGFANRWQNVGTLESRTWEASLGARLVQTRDFSWSARVLYDNTSSVITRMNVPDFRYGVAGQNMGNVFLAREGETLGTFYGPIAARSCADLPTDVSCDGFTVNDDGYLVWIGSGSLADNAWGTTSGTTLVRGAPVNWGTPFQGECDDRVTGDRGAGFCKVGNTMPDYTVSFSSNLEWRGLSVYGLLDAVQGFSVWNQPQQWALFRENIGLMDQSRVPEAQRKPIGYFTSLYTPMGGLVPNDVWVEDASFVKLREVSIRYRVTADQLERLPVLGGFNSLGLTVSGKNLRTWTDYRGYDPEVGRAGGDTGSATLARVDGFNYPNFRTWTFGVELNF